jgi:Tfp pilus assembly protein PilV
LGDDELAVGASGLRRDDDGFGMVEALISMFLLALVAVAFLPLIITGLRAATANTTVTTATQAVNEQLSPISAHEFTCDEIRDWLAADPAPLNDPRGVTIHLHREAGPTSVASDNQLICSPGGTVTITVSATSDDDPGAAGATTYASAEAIVRIE